MNDEGSDNKAGERVLLRKGYTPAPMKDQLAQDGFKPAAGELGSPPTQGSAVSKPAQSKQD